MDENFAGGNRLIKRNQAALIENARDLMRCMNWSMERKKPEVHVQTHLFSALSEDETALLGYLRAHPDGVHVNELAIKTAKPYSAVSSVLLSLEFKGLVKPMPGGVYRIIK